MTVNYREVHLPHLKKPALAIIIALTLAAALSVAPRPALCRDLARPILNADINVLDGYAIVVDGATVQTDVPPVERGGIVFVSLRFAAEALNADVSWYRDEKKAVIIFPGDRTVTMIAGRPDVEMGDMQKILPVAPFLFEDRLMIPLRATAEFGYYRINENEKNAILSSREKQQTGISNPEDTSQAGGKKATASLDMIREKAHKDAITKKMRPLIFTSWGIMFALWIIITAIGSAKGQLTGNGWKSALVLFLMLTLGMYLVMFSGVMLSTCWAALVILITALVGLVSTETYTDKLLTMASTAQGAGLICTLFGLGLLIGPAIAARDIAAIGYGIYVKIEPTITGLCISILFSMLYSTEARRARQGVPQKN